MPKVEAPTAGMGTRMHPHTPSRTSPRASIPTLPHQTIHEVATKTDVWSSRRPMPNNRPHTHQRRDNSYSEGEARMKICTDLRSLTFVTCHHRRLDPSQSSPTPTKQSTGICAHAESRLPTYTTTKKTLVVVIVVTQDTTSDPPNNRLCTCQPWCRTHPSPRKCEGDRWPSSRCPRG